ncbi:MAG: Ig-like domain-containing protein [Patescibacteria group bacterium]|jgi:hypothetical protein
MTKRFKIALLVVLILALLGGIYGLFWSLGSLQTTAAPKLQLVMEKGTASVVRAGSQTKESASNGMELKPGDQVMTDQGAAVSITSFDRAVTRLDENTTLTITEASLQGTSFVARWKLEAGRAWSRVLRLMDLDSAYEGQSNQVIATVRGTSFVMTASQDKVSLMVEHAAIREAKNKNAKPEFLVGGQWMDLKPTGEVMSRGETPTSTLSDDIRQRINLEEDVWRKANLEEDEKFSKDSATNLLASLGSAKGIKPDSWLYDLSLWSENWHLWLAGKNSPELQSRYIGRRLGHIIDLIGRGKSGLAYQMLSQVDKDVDALLNGSRGSDYRAGLKPVISRVMLAVSDVDPSSNVFRYKLDVEDLYARVWDDSPAQTFYARSLSVDARLDEGERFNCDSKDSDQVKEAINAVEQGMARQKNDYAKIKSGLTNIQRSILEDKMQVQGLRLDFLNKRLQACAVSGQGADISGANATSTAATSTEVVPSTPTSSSLVAPTKNPPPKTPTTTATNPTTKTPTNPTTLGLVRIELFVQPNPATVGDKANLYVKGYKLDGSTPDVTSNATFQVIGSLGTLVGSTYQTSKAGSVTIIATVLDGTQKLTTQTSLAINQGVTLSRISIRPSGTNLKPGQSQALTVTAYYSSGFSKDVTADATWSVSNALAHMSGSTLVAGNSAGGVTVTAQYSESGTTVTTDAFFQIVSLAAATLQ